MYGIIKCNLRLRRLHGNVMPLRNLCLPGSTFLPTEVRRSDQKGHCTPKLEQEEK